MTLQDFIKKYDGKKLDWDGSFGAQCVDLYRFYVSEVLGFPQSPPVASAFQVWDTAPAKYYDKTPYNPMFAERPQAGDVVVWNEGIGKHGHIAVCVTPGSVFEQNRPLGSACHVGAHDYKFVIGWLRPKAFPQYRTQNYKGELRIVLRADSMATWEALCKVYGLNPNSIEEIVPK